MILRQKESEHRQDRRERIEAQMRETDRSILELEQIIEKPCTNNNGIDIPSMFFAD